MEILNISEPKNGFVTMNCEFDQEELEILLSYAVTNILTEQIKKMKDIKVCFDCGQEITKETLQDYPDTELCIDCLNNE
jgi:RNA polymerase-binding transcription factor DksA